MAFELRVIFCVLVGLQVCQVLGQNDPLSAAKQLQDKSKLDPERETSKSSQLLQTRIDLSKNLVDMFFRPIVATNAKYKNDPTVSSGWGGKRDDDLNPSSNDELAQHDPSYVEKRDDPLNPSSNDELAQPGPSYVEKRDNDVAYIPQYTRSKLYGSFMDKRDDDVVQGRVVKRSPSGRSFLGPRPRFIHSFDETPVDDPQPFASPKEED